MDGQTKGRIVISLFDDVPVASQRFIDLARGQEGISYQLSKVAEIGPVRADVAACWKSCSCTACNNGQGQSTNTEDCLQSFIRVGDLQSLSYAAEANAKIAGGDTTEQLEVRMSCMQSLSAQSHAAGCDHHHYHVQVELEESRHSHSEPGMVSLVVKDNKERCVSCGASSACMSR